MKPTSLGTLGSGSRLGRPASLLAVLLLTLHFAAAGLVGATGQTITSPIVVNTTVSDDAHDTFIVTAPSGGKISVKFRVTGGENVDVWVFTASELAEYEDLSVMYFGYTTVQEHTKSWSGSVASNGATRYFVVDNEYVSESGARPSGPVQYTAEFVSGDASSSSALFGIVAALGLLTALAVAGGVIHSRRNRVRQAAQSQLSPYGGDFYGSQTTYGQAAPAQYAGQPGSAYDTQYGASYGSQHGGQYAASYGAASAQQAYGSPSYSSTYPQQQPYGYASYGSPPRAPSQPVYAQIPATPKPESAPAPSPPLSWAPVAPPPAPWPSYAYEPPAPQPPQPPRPQTPPFPASPARPSAPTLMQPPQKQWGPQPPPPQQPQGPQPPRKPPIPPGG